jgi:hypothetical protein
VGGVRRAAAVGGVLFLVRAALRHLPPGHGSAGVLSAGVLLSAAVLLPAGRGGLRAAAGRAGLERSRRYGPRREQRLLSVMGQSSTL